MRKAFRYLHLWLGLASGLVVFIVAITGCIYAFEKEIKSIVYQDILSVEKNDSAQSLDKLLSAVKKEYKKPGIKTIFVPADSTSSVQFNLKNKLSVFLNPYTGAITGTIHQDNSFFGIVLQIHRSLLLGEFGKKITGISAFIFLFMIISGMILWWPKGKLNKQKFSLKRNTSPKRLNYDLHSVMGFYASWIIIFTVFTGLIWSFKWLEAGMYSMAGSKKEKKQYHSAYIDSTCFSLEKTLSLCRQEFPDHKEIFIAFPEDSNGVYRFNLRNNNYGGFYKYQHQLYFDQYTGNIIKKQLFEETQKGDKLKAINYDVHTGKILGLPGQLLVFFAALITASLPITGFIMWRNKRKKKQFFFTD
jgi:uncharacterized iron-regulated membrane protein